MYRNFFASSCGTGTPACTDVEPSWDRSNGRGRNWKPTPTIIEVGLRPNRIIFSVTGSLIVGEARLFLLRSKDGFKDRGVEQAFMPAIKLIENRLQPLRYRI